MNKPTEVHALTCDMDEDCNCAHQKGPVSFTAQPKGECQDPSGDCGAICHCGDYVEGHGWHDGHSAVPMQCDGCDPLLKCDECGELVSRVYSHQHTHAEAS